MMLISVISLISSLIFYPNIFKMLGFKELSNSTDLDINVNGIDITKAQEIADWLRVGFIHHTLDRQINMLDVVISKNDMQRVFLQFGQINYAYNEFDVAYTNGASFSLYDAFRYYIEWHSDKIKDSTKQKIKDKLILDGYIL